MSILTNLLSKPERRSNFREDYEWLLGGNRTASGELISEKSALTISAYYAAMRAISEDVGKLPLFLFRRLDPRGKERMTDHPLNWRLHDAPNDETSSMTFRETLMSHALGWGNGYAEIVREGPDIQMFILLPWLVTVTIKAGRVHYEVRNEDRSEAVTLRSDQVFHLHGLGPDGIVGYSIARQARETLGATKAAETSGAALFGNMSRPGGILETPGKMEPEGRKNLTDQFNDVYGGAANQHKTIVLEKGVTFTPVAIPNKDSQWLEARNFDIEEIARWFRIPPHKIQHLLHATFSNIQEQSMEYVVDTLLPWLRRWEQEAAMKLLLPSERRDLFVEHIVDGLLRGNVDARNKAYSTGRQWGWYSANDVRELENLNPIGDQGDTYIVPLNMGDAEDVGEDDEPVAGDTEGTTDEGASDQDDTRTATVAAIVDSHLPSFKDAYSRILTVEYDRAKRAAKQEKLEEWLTKLGEEHIIYVRGILILSVEMFCGTAWAMLCADPMPDLIRETIADHTQDMAERHVRMIKDTVPTSGVISRDSILKVVPYCELERLGALMLHLSSDKVGTE